MPFTIGIVGLGLMGASLAYALRGFRAGRLLGTDTDALVCQRAEAAGCVHHATTQAADVLAAADLVLFCVYAKHIPGLLEQHASVLKPGVLLGDICGVKEPLYAAIAPLLPAQCNYVGLHPMAGKECDGFEHADPHLYRGCSMILTPTPRSNPQSLADMQALASHIGAARTVVATPAEHDSIIGYTSDLMHVAAVGLCLSPHPKLHPAFTAGAFRDGTRVANINADAWTELLLENRSHTAIALAQYIANLQAVLLALNQNDPQALHALLQSASDHKRAFLLQ